MKLTLFGLALTGLLAAGAVRADAAADSLPFGLDSFHWGMSEDEAAKQYASIGANATEPLSFLVPPSVGYRVWPYQWHGCVIELRFEFTPEGLDYIRVWSADVEPSCLQALKDEIAAHYGKGSKADPRDQPMMNGEEIYSWTNPQTSVRLTIADNTVVDVRLQKPGAPPLNYRRRSPFPDPGSDARQPIAFHP